MNSFVVTDFELESGTVLDRAVQAFEVVGTLNAARDNAILFPTRVAGRIEDNFSMVGPGRALDPSRYCIIIPALLGNGESSSPSNTKGTQAGGGFPAVSIGDAVRLQHHLVVDYLGVDRLHAAVGWSMGGQQAYHWASLYPEAVPRVAAICSAASTSPFSRLFLQGLEAALKADAAWCDGDYVVPPATGLKALGRVWAPWAFSESWYRRAGYQALGFATLDAFVTGFWEAAPLGWDANDILCHIRMWLAHDIGLITSNRESALRRITARMLLMPCTTDAYFQVEDNLEEARFVEGARVFPIESDWGHMAGSGMSPRDCALIDAELAILFAAPN